MTNFPKCPKCDSSYTYEDGGLLICPDCSHEWSTNAVLQNVHQNNTVKDAYGNILTDGDLVTIIKDLKIKGSSSVVKVGTKLKILRLVDSDHNIDCKINGIGSMLLKSQFVKKVF